MKDLLAFGILAGAAFLAWKLLGSQTVSPGSTLVPTGATTPALPQAQWGPAQPNNTARVTDTSGNPLPAIWTGHPPGAAPNSKFVLPSNASVGVYTAPAEGASFT